MAAQTVPFRRFSTDALPRRERFGAWREAMTAVYEIAAPDEEDRARFSGVATSAHLGPLIVGTMDVDPLAYHRSPARIRADGMDHFIVRLDRAGVAGNAQDEILVKDMGQALVLPAMRLDGACIIVPRDVMTAMLPRADALHGTRLRGVMGRLLADHMLALAEAAPALGVREAPLVARAAREMIAACLAPSHDTLAPARPQMRATAMAQARRYVDAHLTDPALTAERLCRHLGLSRSALYHLFEPHHGVARYIQGRRLARVRDLLADPAERRRIGDLAFDHGFASEAHFSRAFRRAFGCTPSEVRGGAGAAAARRSRAAGRPAAGEFPDWLRRLGD
ncbi:helix-turn-helix domain-containing protein [Azospirillum sp. ST 5-10]|uniref:helix-turn-helix domain-containing protein n=1 Tax=unclassified Azospirillum TaxID=2630922 RepID=UPI003F49C579